MTAFTFRPPGGFVLIAGPCTLETDELNERVAAEVASASARAGWSAIFKGSFDKANRTSGASPRGPGMERGLEALERVRTHTGLPVLTDIHLPAQAGPVGQVVDAIQIPAFLSRQSDLLAAAGETGCPVNIKKGQWMAPEQIEHSVEKVRDAGGGVADIAVTERGTAFGYGRWVVDMRSFSLMRDAAHCPAIFDATHAVQLPGGAGRASAGEPRFIETLALAAVAAGADGLFVEVHPDPASAPSDGATMLPLDRLGGLVDRVARLREALA